MDAICGRHSFQKDSRHEDISVRNLVTGCRFLWARTRAHTDSDRTTSDSQPNAAPAHSNPYP